MRLKEIRGLPVVDPTAARKIGTVTDYLVDSAGGRLAALEVGPVESSDGGAATTRVPAHRIRRIGQHAVVLTGRAASTTTPPDSAAEERWLDAASLVGLEVLGDDGNRIGHLTDASFDQDTLDVQAYLLHSNLWERLFGRRRGRILPPQVASCSRELMIVTTGRLKEEVPAPEEETTASLGVPLKLEDRLPSPRSGSKVAAEDGQAVSAVRHTD
jgi:sporulation protein YlmC with PRC-barrel domain